MVKSEHYDLEKVAEVLSIPTAEVNRLREQGKIRGFRDGAGWKFQKEDIHNYLAESIKARSGNGDNGRNPGDSDFDILGTGGSPSSFDLLVENAAPLPDDNQLVSVSPQMTPSSDLDLAALDNDDELALAEETRISSVVMPQKAKKVQSEESSIVADEDSSSSSLGLAPASQADAVELDDNESVLGGSGSSPQLGLAGDSGFDMLIGAEDSDLVANEDSDLLQVDDENTSAVFPAEDFVLEPSAKEAESDDSESSSQVIAIDGPGFAGAGQDDPFGQADFGTSDFSSFDSGIQESVAPMTNDPFGSGSSPFPDAFPVSSPSVTVKKSDVPAEEYSTGMFGALLAALFVMLPTGYMLVDTMTHMWSWSEPFILSSMLMDMVSGVFGL